MENTEGKTALGLDKNIGGLLCYMPICAIGIIYSILVLVMDKENADMKFHAFQSLLLSVMMIVALVGMSILNMIVGAVTGSLILSMLLSLVSFAILIGFIILLIVGCVKAYQGQMWKAPIVGNMAEGWSS